MREAVTGSALVPSVSPSESRRPLVPAPIEQKREPFLSVCPSVLLVNLTPREGRERPDRAAEAGGRGYKYLLTERPGLGG